MCPVWYNMPLLFIVCLLPCQRCLYSNACTLSVMNRMTKLSKTVSRTPGCTPWASVIPENITDASSLLRTLLCGPTTCIEPCMTLYVPLNWGHLSVKGRQLGPKGVHYEEAPLAMHCVVLCVFHCASSYAVGENSLLQDTKGQVLQHCRALLLGLLSL